jgi:hypothetical protein
MWVVALETTHLCLHPIKEVIVVLVLYMGCHVNIWELTNKYNTTNKHMRIEKQAFGC